MPPALCLAQRPFCAAGAITSADDKRSVHKQPPDRRARGQAVFSVQAPSFGCSDRPRAVRNTEAIGNYRRYARATRPASANANA